MEKIKFKPGNIHSSKSEHTLLQNVAELKAQGDWYLSNYFTFVVTSVVNGHPVGKISGSVTGDNIGYCYVCGTYIVNHYTIRDTKTGTMFNVGCECINRFTNEDRATSYKKGVNSVKNKAKSDYLRPIKHKALSEWLQKVAVNSDKIRNPKHHNWLQECWLELVESGDMHMEYDIIRDSGPYHDYNDYSFVTRVKMLEERNKYYLDGTNIDYWQYHAKQFPIKDWNPDNMRNQYIAEAKRYGTEEPPAWSKLFTLTEEQEKAMNDLIVKRVTKHLEIINKRDIRNNGPCYNIGCPSMSNGVCKYKIPSWYDNCNNKILNKKYLDKIKGGD